jgi:hypothetical protein
VQITVVGESIGIIYKYGDKKYIPISQWACQNKEWQENKGHYIYKTKLTRITLM